MIYLLLAFVTTLFLISVFVFGYDIIAPSCLLCGGFLCATVCACLYNFDWNFTNYKLLLLVVLGLMSFILGAFFIQICDCNNNNCNRSDAVKFVPIDIHRNKLLIYLAWQIIILGLMLFALDKNIGLKSGLAFAISSYYEANKTGEIVFKSGIANLMQILNTSGMYLLIFIMMHNIICKHKNDVLIYINIILGSASSLLNGTRTAFFMYAIACVIVFLGEKNIQNRWKGNIDFKIVSKILIVIFLLMATFNVLAVYQGRTLTSMSMIDVFVTYLGAPLKNLELYISENHVVDSIFGGGTFFNTYTWIYEKTNIALFDVPKLNDYRFLNGKGLGNVYTIFLPLYSDFGLLGSSIVMGIIGGISQKFYENFKKKSFYKNLNWGLIIYSYVGFAVSFSFFSNKFFEQVIARAMIYFIVGLWLFDLFFFRLQIKRGLKIAIKRNLK